MATFRLTIDCGNAAFAHEDPHYSNEARDKEVARMLCELADKLERTALEMDETLLLRDSNGNYVGSCEFSETV